VVAAEDERELVGLARALDDAGDALARCLDLAEEAGALVPLLGRLGDVGRDVAAVDDLQIERREPLREPRVANRGRPHVDTAATCAEVERRADHCDGLHKRRLTGSQAEPG
jgi:hypothetical protein